MSVRMTTASRTTPAVIAMAGAAAFIILLAALHVLRPDLDPAWTVISAYGLGETRWLMAMAFAAMAAGCAALCVQLRPEVETAPAWIGWALLWVSAAGFALAAVFPTDPIEGVVRRTTAGRLHEAGAMLGGTIPLAALALTWALAKRSEWAASRKALWAATALVWAGLIVFVVSMATQLPPGGALGPGVNIGWPSRLLVAGYAAWVVACAWLATRAVARALDTRQPAGQFRS
jgi:hypothetical protein